MVMMAQGKIAQSNFNRILNLFRTFSSICADFHFGEKMPGCLYFFSVVCLCQQVRDKKRDFLFAQLLANRVATCSCSTCTVYCCMDRFPCVSVHVRATDSATSFYRMQMYSFALVSYKKIGRRCSTYGICSMN